MSTNTEMSPAPVSEGARLRQGFGWKRWSRRWLYDSLGLFNDDRVSYIRSSSKAAPAR